MATVLIQRRKRKDHTSYLVTFKDPLTGRKKHYKTFSRYKDAQSAANDLRALIDSGKLGDIEKSKVKITLLSFAEVSASLEEEWAKRLSLGALQPKTVDGYLNRLQVLNRVFGPKMLCEITSEEIIDYRSNVLAESSAITANRNLFVIKQVFKHGQLLSAVFNNPVKEIAYVSEKDHERSRFLLPEDLTRLVEASRKTRAKFYLPALIYLGAEHGASRQECLSLKWSDIDFHYEGQGIIRLYRSKNKKQRTEYLMPRTREALCRWREHLEWMRKRRQVESNGADHVFCRLDGRPIQRFDTAWREALRIAGLEDFHFHDLRHTFCSNLLLSGSDLKDVKEMIGHSDLAMTDRYSHLTAIHKRSQQVKLAEHYAKGTGNNQKANEGM